MLFHTIRGSARATNVFQSFTCPGAMRFDRKMTFFDTNIMLFDRNMMLFAWCFLIETDVVCMIFFDRNMMLFAWCCLIETCCWTIPHCCRPLTTEQHPAIAVAAAEAAAKNNRKRRKAVVPAVSGEGRSDNVVDMSQHRGHRKARLHTSLSEMTAEALSAHGYDLSWKIWQVLSGWFVISTGKTKSGTELQLLRHWRLELGGHCVCAGFFW